MADSNLPDFCIKLVKPNMAELRLGRLGFMSSLFLNQSTKGRPNLNTETMPQKLHYLTPNRFQLLALSGHMFPYLELRTGHLSLPKDGGHLEIELIDKICNGRVVPDLCVKVMKPEYGGTLAREAWFYEQLALEANCERVITTRSFGFFTVPLRDCFDVEGRPVSRIEPWENITIKPPEPNSDETDGSDDGEGADWRLPDDLPYLGESFKDDDKWRSGSPWNARRASPSNPLICVLVLKNLGNKYSSHEEHGEKPRSLQEEELNGICDVVHDLGSTEIMHKDL
ncbi:uncharacterized protein BT62DRAFT_1046435 [Guyanagaster necrorhizus]|uniref:Uncharacterized protein n=1 Tax=Guyanagaster necrorhizus TaxID=856835 RepID=A0A9P7VIR6_9AGAR|nr:uncharacterized protein BT62DRAFT_1046435 [Guyanagaster necrorhizus MCA 3950]KAG7441105.1 hypothetical protein BT62DRAFT_1046435 [Guyanagaster necrorhizus MCA 3950]